MKGRGPLFRRVAKCTGLAFATNVAIVVAGVQTDGFWGVWCMVGVVCWRIIVSWECTRIEFAMMVAISFFLNGWGVGYGEWGVGS